MTLFIERPDPFVMLGAVQRAWGETATRIVSAQIEKKATDQKEFLSQETRFLDSETLMMFGYVARSEAKTGRNGIMQSTIVNALVPEEEGITDREKARIAQKRQSVRQDIKRRADALIFFGLVSRAHLSKVAVEFALTDAGLAAYETYQRLFEAELLTQYGGPECIAAE